MRHVGRILFVCTANIFRSPTAEAMFNALVEDLGLPVREDGEREIFDLYRHTGGAYRASVFQLFDYLSPLVTYLKEER